MHFVRAWIGANRQTVQGEVKQDSLIDRKDSIDSEQVHVLMKTDIPPVLVYLYLSVNIYTFTFISLYPSVDLLKHVCATIYLSISIYIHLSVCICLEIYFYIYLSTCLYISISLCVYIYQLIHTNFDTVTSRRRVKK